MLSRRQTLQFSLDPADIAVVGVFDQFGLEVSKFSLLRFRMGERQIVCRSYGITGWCAASSRISQYGIFCRVTSPKKQKSGIQTKGFAVSAGT